MVCLIVQRGGVGKASFLSVSRSIIKLPLLKIILILRSLSKLLSMMSICRFGEIDTGRVNKFYLNNIY